MSSSLEGLENSHRYVYFLRKASVTEGIEGDRITINVPLFKKLRDIIFLCIDFFDP